MGCVEKCELICEVNFDASSSSSASGDFASREIDCFVFF